MSATPIPSLSADEASAAALLRTLLDVSLTGVILFRPVYEASGTTIIDLGYEHLNPAAQRMLQLPERPAESFLTLYPSAVGPEGVFAFYRATFLSGEVGRHQFNYQYDGLDGYFYLVAQRQGPVLVVSFTDTNDQPRTAVELALRESQAREQAARAEAERQRNQWQALVNQAPVGIGYFEGPDLCMSATNDLLSAMLGYAQADLLNRPLLEAVPELKNQGFAELMQQVRETRQPFIGTEVPAQLLRQGQLTDTYYNFVYQPLYGSQGEVLGIIDVAVEVTEQVRARQRVQTLNEELAAINEEITASNAEYQLANTALAEAQQQLQQLNAGLEGRVRERTREAQTARLEAERQRGALQRVFEQAPVALFVAHGPTHILQVVNPLMAVIMGRPLAELLERPFFEALPELRNQGLPAVLSDVRSTGTPFVAQEQVFRLAHHRPGESGYYNFVYQPLRADDGQVTAIVCVAIEVTEPMLARRQVQDLNEKLAAINEELTATNEELHRSNTHLGRTNTDLGTFVYTASHDLKAPITNIEGLVAALRDTLPAAVQQDQVIAHLLGLLDDTVQRFLTTITQLTDLSRLQSAYEEPADALALAPVVAGVLADLAPAIAEAQAAVEVRVPAALRVSFAPAGLRSIVYNLLSNAVKYRDPQRPAQVVVEAERQLAGVVLTVRDNGLGLTASQQQRLFGLFQRLHTHVEGSGVGLYMIKRLLENAGATIAVTSQPAAGTTFTVTFPA